MNLDKNIARKARIQWIDSCKGIGMIAVVLGHGVAAAATYIFFFHMPLFFFISGYLYKERPGYLDFARRKARHLLVPYISFLALLSLPAYAYYILNLGRNPNSIEQINLLTFKILYGGASLSNALGTFWFITCLFLTQQIYALVYARIKSQTALVGLAIAAYVLAMFQYWFFPEFTLPWSIEVIPMAFVFYILGHLVALNSVQLEKFSLVAIAAIVAGLILHHRAGLDINFAMKYRYYGVPIVNFLMAGSGIIATIFLSKITSQNSLLNRTFTEIGAASMVILCLHQSVLFGLNKTHVVPSDVLRSAIAIFIPYLIYKFIVKFEVLRRFFLGESPRIART